MRLTLSRLQAEGFKAHVSLDVRFTEGLNVVGGPNASGKTCILKGVLFCLGGATFAGGSKTLVNDKCTRVTATATFTGDATVEINRTKSSATVKVDGELVAKGTSPVNQYVEREILGMPMKRFMSLRIGRQKLVAALLTAGTTELHSIIEELGDVTTVNSVISKCGFLAAGSDTAKENMAAWRDEMEASEAAAETLVAQLEKAQTTLDGLKKEHTSLKAAWEADKQALELAQNHNRTARDHNERLRLLQAAVGTAERNLDNATGVEEPDAEDLMAAEGALREAEEAVKAAWGALSAAQQVDSQRTALQQRLARLTYPKPVAEPDTARMQVLSQQIDEGWQTIADLKSKSNAANESAQGSVCPACNRPFKDHDPEALKAEASRLAAELRQAQADQQCAQGEWQELDRAHRALLQYQQELDSVRGVEAEVTAALEELPEEQGRGELDAAHAREVENRDVWKGKVQVLVLQGERARASAEAYQRMQAELSSAKAALEAHGEGVQLRDEGVLNARHSDSFYAYTNNVNAVTLAEAEVRGLDSQYDQIAAQYERLEERVKDAEDTLKKTATASALQKYLRENRDRFLKNAWEQITVSASAFSTTVTEGAVQGMRRTEGGFEWHNGTDWYGPEDASGAQATVMGIGVQQALAQLLPCGLDLIALDEPTADASEEVSAAIMMMLASLGHQVIVVSHKHQDAAVAQNLITLDKAA